MKRTLFSIAALVCASLVFFSCSKSDPVYTDDSQALTTVFEVKSADWQAVQGRNEFSTGYNIDELTNSITESGAVWIYFSFDDGGTYELAPSLSRPDQNGNTFDFLAESGTDDQKQGFITLTALKYSGNTNAAPKFSSPNLVVKVVSIPSSLYQAHKNVNKENYNEVKRVFNLK